MLLLVQRGHVARKGEFINQHDVVVRLVHQQPNQVRANKTGSARDNDCGRWIQICAFGLASHASVELRFSMLN